MAYPTGISQGTLTDMATGTLANFMPVITAKECKAFMMKNLVCLPLFNRDFEKYLISGGDTIQVNPLLEVGVEAVNTAAAPTPYNTDQGAYISLIINYWYESYPVGVNDFQDKRGVPDYMTAILPRLSYAVAKQIDTSVAALFSGVTNYVGTDGDAVTLEILLNAKEYLDKAEVPEDDRVLIIDPGTHKDLMLDEAFVNSLYGAKDAIGPGELGHNQVLGCNVYKTTNLAALNTSYHYAFMGHRDALLVALPDGGIKPATWREESRHTTFHRASAWWGCVEFRDDHGVYIKTRS